jgi:hypothetical protein
LTKKDYAEILKTAISSIAGVQSVTFALLTRDQVTAFPSFSIQTGAVQRKPLLESGWDAYEVTVNYVIIGYITCLDDPNLVGKLTLAAWEWEEKVVNKVLEISKSERKVLLVQSEEPFLDHKKNYAEIAVTVVAQFTHGQTI